jgi:ABC-type lipoprotein release transport system permease subunit
VSKSGLTSFQLIQRSLTHYWRTNLAVVLGVATAVTVLGGALLVGDSVRGSLRDLVLQRLGTTDYAVVSSGFFRDQLAQDLKADPAFSGDFTDVSPLIVTTGLASDQDSGRRVLGVQVYGVDDRFWKFLGSDASLLGDRDVLLSSALARDLGAQKGSTILLRMQQPSDIPIDSMHGKKEEVGQTIRFTLTGVLPPERGGDFSLQPQQGEVRAAFVPIARLRSELDVGNTANVLVVSQKPERRERRLEQLVSLVKRKAQLDDVGLSLRVLEPQGALSLEGAGSLINDSQAAAAAEAARQAGLMARPVFSYLANDLRVGARSIPYSLVTAIDIATIDPSVETKPGTTPPIVLNAWAARDLDAAPGDDLTLTYYFWEESGALVERTAQFRVASVVPMSGNAADRDLVPVYPGITDSPTFSDWDPPFPIDLRRVRQVDEDYWRDYRTTPKAFLPFEVGQALWRSRHGSMTSIRLGADSASVAETFRGRLQAQLDPFTAGFAARDARAEGLAASRGATDFGEYFTYFSFFLVVSALLLAQLFFKLGVEQRGREVGLLRAVGLTTQTVRKLFIAEAIGLSLVGSLIGVLGAIGYGELMMYGLRTWWVDAVGTTALRLHVSPVSLVAGAAGGLLASLAAIWWTLRKLARVSERSLLAGEVQSQLMAGSSGPAKYRAAIGVFLLALGIALAAAGAGGVIPQAGAFFGAGAALLVACLFGLAWLLHRQPRAPLAGHGLPSLARLGFRHTSHRPGRSVLAVAVMASATFVLISVGAFRKGEAADPSDVRSGTGGYELLVDSMLPIVYDPNSREGRELTGLSDAKDVTITPFRVRPGDDASCLNLYEPRRPRILGVKPTFIASGRFQFQSSLADSAEDLANPWRLLEKPVDAEKGDAVPVIADANSMNYVLHRALGEEIEIAQGGRTLRLKLVAALADSVFQGELLMSEANFMRLFPEQAGYQLLLVDVPEGRLKPAPTSPRNDEIALQIEEGLKDFGADAMPVAGRIGEFHRVENTYLSTFQALGGLGLLLGTIGLAAVLLRNVLERRRELALLGAVGYGRPHLLAIIVAENAFLLITGIAVGTLCALIAIAPAALERGGRVPIGTGQWLLLFAVLATGLLSSVIATRAAVQSRLLSALRAE